MVALTKSDLEAADPTRVKQQLLAEGLELEEVGGTVQVLPSYSPLRTTSEDRCMHYVYMICSTCGLVSDARRWGDQVVETSAATGAGLGALEEALLLQAEEMDLRASPSRPAEALVVESRMDKGQVPFLTFCTLFCTPLAAVMSGPSSHSDRVLGGAGAGGNSDSEAWDSEAGAAGGGGHRVGQSPQPQGEPPAYLAINPQRLGILNIPCTSAPKSQ